MAAEMTVADTPNVNVITPDMRRREIERHVVDALHLLDCAEEEGVELYNGIAVQFAALLQRVGADFLRSATAQATVDAALARYRRM
jgi:hypothetical protein